MTTTAQKIPSGYKQTDIGVVPADWDIKRIEELTPQGKKYGIVDGPFGSNLKTEHYRKSGIPIITSGYVTDGHFSADEYLYVDKEKFKQEKRSAVKGGDIVMAKIGARCGASAILPKNHAEGILSGNALKISIDENRFSTFFVWQILWNLYSRGDLESIRSTGAQPALSMANLKKYQIAIPTVKAQQEDIATALSDADELIDKLKFLIAKKRNIKRGAMQELLSGKCRLPGFSEKWETKKLGDLLDYEQPTPYLVKNTDYSDSHSIPVLTAGKTFILGYTAEETGVFQNLPTIIFDDFTTAMKYVDFPFKAKSSAMKMLVPKNKDVNLKFVFAKMQLIDFKLGDHKRYWISEYQNIEIATPKPDEQTAIASTLSDMDTEIEKLESQLTKYQDIKQGMMQSLLTGKIRLLAK
ncbi:MAG: restriction endonuclease subunit S [Patescibacteria group bacterium]|jgi:type I restriction enzyme S subunit